jgi:Uma2 family endonuclease
MVGVMLLAAERVRCAHGLLRPFRRAEHIMAMPAVDRSKARQWTVREVRQLIAESPLDTPRYELVDGELLVTPSPNFAHQRAVRELIIALAAYLKGTSLGEVLHSPFDVELESESLTQPDVFVLGPAEAKRLTTEMPARNLLIAAEVLSPSSARHDRVTKRRLYQRHVSEYWIIDVQSRLIERWVPNDDRPEILVELLEWKPDGAAEAFRLELPRYFAECVEG